MISLYTFKMFPRSSGFWKNNIIAPVLTGVMLFIQGCAPQTIIQNQLDGVFDSLVKVYQEETDIILVRDAFPFNLKTLDALALQNYDNPNLQLAAASSYVMFTYGFIMEDADRTFPDDINQGMIYYRRALNLFVRAEEYANRSLEIKFPDWENGLKERNIDQFKLTKEDVPALYWLAAAIGGGVSASRGAPEYLIDLPLVGLLLEKAIELDPEWNAGSLYAAMISYSISRPDAKDNADLEALEYFKKANGISKGLDCSYYVSVAEKVYLKRQDRNKFLEYLNKALEVDMDSNPSLKLSNALSKSRAEWLIGRVNDLFY